MTEEFLYSYNATVGLNSMSTVTNQMSLLAVVIITAILLGIAIGAVESKVWKSKWLKTLGSSLYYFGWGLLGMVVFALPATIIWSIYNEVSSGNISIPFDWIGYCIVGYVVISGLGWIIKHKIADKLPKQRKPQIKKQSDGSANYGDYK